MVGGSQSEVTVYVLCLHCLTRGGQKSRASPHLLALQAGAPTDGLVNFQIEPGLVQEALQGFDEILLYVEAIVSHFGREEQVCEARLVAALEESLGLRVRNELVFDPMDNKNWYGHVPEHLRIVQPFSDQRGQKTAHHSDGGLLEGF